MCMHAVHEQKQHHPNVTCVLVVWGRQQLARAMQVSPRCCIAQMSGVQLHQSCMTGLLVQRLAG
jgi:hypothetical protein